jgi:hypothetical protein
MTPKEKAEELVGKCFDAFINDEDEHYVETAWKLSKQCALIVLRDTIWGYLDQMPIEVQNYWIEVKQEIEKL